VRKKRTELTAFILSGGKSNRIGKNKAFFRIQGIPFIQKLVELLDLLFEEVIISSNNIKEYQFLNKKIIKDLIPERGPLSGIHSALNFSNTKKNFILSCDLPLISEELISYICDYHFKKQILLPKAEGRIQQLCGIYSNAVLPDVENLLIESSKPGSKLKGSIYELIARVDTEIADVDAQNFYHSNLFMNLNTLEDYNHLKEIVGDK
jgi:molybdopterin-guanine dinucleotide biosynthesis protein A